MFSFWNSLAYGSACWTVYMETIVVSDFCQRWDESNGWKYSILTKQLIHIKTQKCAEAEVLVDDITSQLSLATCDDESRMQKWSFDEVNTDLLKSKWASVQTFVPPNTLL